MQTPTFPLLPLTVASNSGIPQERSATQGDKGRQQLLVITDGGTIGADSLGFRASLPDGNFVDSREGFTVSDDQIKFAIPDQTFSANGRVTCYFYVFDGDTILASTNKFTYIVAPQFERGVGGSSYSKTLETLKADMESTLADLKTEVSKWMASADVEGEVKRQLASTLTAIDTWEQTQTAAMQKVLADKEAALDKAQADYVTEHNNIVADIASLTKAQTSAETATKQATDAASEATTAQKTATDAASKATTSAGNADKATASATQATADAQTQIKALTDKLASVDADWADQQKSIQASADAQIKTISDSLADWQRKIDSAGTDIESLKTAIAEIQAGVPVKTVGGQKPDENGNIDMDAYATLGGDNNWSGKNDFGTAPAVAGDTVVTASQLAIAGRNLFLNTAHYVGDAWNGLVGAVNGVFAGTDVINCPNAWNGPKYLLAKTAEPISVGDIVTFSAFVRNTSTTKSANVFMYGNGNGTKAATIEPNTPWTRISVTTKIIGNALTGSIRFESSGGTSDGAGGCLQQAAYQLERGSIATPYHPAPEDAQTQIDALNNTITALQAQISGGGQ